MAIRVSCKCGKSFAAPDNLAGKRVKCPGCSEPLAVPIQNNQPTGSISVSCVCGKSLAVKSDLAGKTIKCPACSAHLQVPALEAAATETVAQPTAARTTLSSQTSEQDEFQSDCIGDLLDEVDLSATSTGFRCPECRAEMKDDAVLCVKCGFNVLKRRKMTTRKVDPYR